MESERIRYLLILIDKMPIQGAVWLKNMVLDRVYPYPEKEPGETYRNYIDSETQIEIREVGQQDFTDERYVVVAGLINFGRLWGGEIDSDELLDKLSWQQIVGRTVKGVVICWT